MDDPLSCEDDMVGVVSVNGGVASAEDWRKALNKVIPAVVVLKITTCRAFDTAIARVSGATGFVVDKHRGIILTNRHVVGPGPVVAQAIFLNREEVPVYPLYRDPVHDFGFFRYDPSAIQFLDYEQIPLAPEAACVGLEIRVVGNDGGEKLSILAGTIARLDRDAPHYKKDGYNDFNTFYMQAASGTKGGSSGSPVIDWQGRAVALNAGSKAKGASAFFLPLHRVVRALSFFLQEEEVVASIPSRGTLQATFHHKGFHEIRRLGLRGQTEQMVRHSSPAGETGMLVVHSVVPGGPAHQHLQPGDILICVNGEVLTEFLKLETLLDDSVNQKIGLQIERGGVAFCVNLMVQDLHSITPNFFLQISGAVIHPLSYQQARNFHFNCGLVYVAKPGYMLSRAGVPRHAIIKKFAGQEISLLDELILALSKLSRGDRVPLEYITYTNRHRSQSALVTVDRHEWYPLPLIYTRDDYNGSWTTMPAFPLGSPFLSLKVHCHGKNIVYETATPIDSEVACLETMLQHTKIDRTDSSTRLCTDDDQEADEFHDSEELNIETKEHKLEEVYADGIDNSDKIEERVEEKLEIVHSTAEQVIEDSLVMLEVDVPSSCLLDGVHLQHLFGTGVVIYHSQSMGLVAIDKSTVPVSVSDVMLSFSAYPMEIPGEVVFLHPVHNYALIAYDPSALGPTGASAVRAAELLPETALQRGDSVHLVGLSRSLQVKSRISTVTNPSAALSIGFAKCPRYRATNMDLIELTTDFGTTFSGVLTDKLGRVQAIWGSFSTQLKCKDYPLVRGIPIYAISEVLEKIVSGAKGPPLVINGIKRPMPLVRILEAELYPTLLSKARSFGLSDNWIQALVKKDPIRRQVLRVKGCLAGSKAERVLKQGDMILAIKNEHITCFRDIELACKELDSSEESKGELNMKILREGQEIELLVGTDVRGGNGTTRMVNWCGCVLQDPHSAVRALGFLPKEGHGVYVTRWCRGSPVHRYGLFSLQWIIEINGRRTPDLDSFVEVAAGLEHDEFIRVKTIRLNGKSQVLTLKQDLHYWPTWEVKFDPETVMWHHKIIKALDGSAL